VYRRNEESRARAAYREERGMSTGSSATEEFKAQVRAAFDAIELGKPFTYRRTFSDADRALFCGISGDFNPYHMDDTFARSS
jgi:3-hydroxybutyryl-CoA dehydratase